jgi:hypothetical protein
MSDTETLSGFIRDPLEWAAECQAQATLEDEPEAKEAFRQLAEEFENAASEIYGLVSTVEALFRRRKLSH